MSNSNDKGDITVYRPSNPDDPARFLIDGKHAGIHEVIELIVTRLTDLELDKLLADSDTANPPQSPQEVSSIDERLI